jgi:uncharacterized RmlC-like cupin family protein
MTVRHIRPRDRTEGAPATPGMTREQAIAADGMWSGLVRTDAGMTSGWHHHGDYDTSIYVVSGALRMEFGPGGRDVIDAVPGDFLHVPKGAVHREGNPSTEAADLVVTRAGTGPPVVNVAGPEPG